MNYIERAWVFVAQNSSFVEEKNMLMKKLIPLSSLALLLALGGCKFFGSCCKECAPCASTSQVATEEAEKKTVEEISAEDLKEKMHHHGHNTVVVDVLDEEHYEDSHIKGAINAPLAELKEKAAHWDKNKDYVVYCASHECPLSAQAYHELKALGFEHVHAFEGGMKEWKEKGFAVEERKHHEDHQK